MVSHLYARMSPCGMLKRWCLAASLLIATSTAAAAATPYNPHGLPAPQLAHIDTICRETMGLSPREAPSGVWGAAQDPHLDPGENHYQGCVASLSDAQRNIDETREGLRADADCRARGLADSSPGLAVCVLGAQRAKASHIEAAENAVNAPTAAVKASHWPGSFLTASPRESKRRERLACAQLALEPMYPAFQACVAHMDDVFFRIDNPQS